MTEKEQEKDEEAPTNPLYGKFFEINKALVETPKKGEVKYSRPMPEEESEDME